MFGEITSGEVFSLANFKNTQGVHDDCQQGVLSTNKLPQHLHAADLVLVICLVQIWFKTP